MAPPRDSRTGAQARVPFFDLSGEVAEDGAELAAAAERVLRSGRYVLGPELEAFERELAEYVGVHHAVGLNSGTDALVLGLRALGVGPGDEVVTTPFTFYATAEGVLHAGATPVFADVDRSTYDLDPARVEEAITPRTRALVPVHLFGQAAPMDELRALAAEHGLAVLEDAAQSIGGFYRERACGALGDLAAFSFYPTKNLGACGDGGALTTDDDGLAERVRLLRNHGSRERDRCEMLGYNSRLDELQAALLRVKLTRLEERNAARRALAGRYDAVLAELDGVFPPAIRAGVHPAYHQYTVRIGGGRRDRVRAALAEAGIGTMVYYSVPVHRLEVYGAGAGELPVAEALCAEVLSLPIYPTLGEAAQERVIEVLRAAVHGA